MYGVKRTLNHYENISTKGKARWREHRDLIVKLSMYLTG